MGYRKFSDIVGEISPERRARIDAMKAEARVDTVAFNAELPSNGPTQAISEKSGNNILSC